MNLRHSLTGKMVALLLVAAVPLYAVGLWIYAIYTSQMETSILENKRAQMEYYIDSLQGELDRLSILEANIINGSDIGSLTTRYPYFSDYDRGVRVNALRDRLISANMSSAYAENVTAYMLPLNKKLSAIGGLDPMNGDDAGLIQQIAASNPYRTCLIDGQLYVAVLRMNRAKTPVYTVAARMSLSQMQSDLAGLKTSVPSDMMIVYNDQYILAQTSGDTEALSGAALSRLEELRRDSISTLRVDGQTYHVICVGGGTPHLYLLDFTPKSGMAAVSRQYIPYFLALTGAAFVLMAVLGNGTFQLVHKPLRRLMQAFGEMENGNMTVSIQHRRRDEFRDVYQSFNHMAVMMDQYVNQSLKQELMLRRAEVMQLQAQINPHFLYNSYFMLHRMVKRRDWQNAEKFSEYMGDYFRYITRNAEQLVPLRLEAEHAKIYSEIQEMRFGGRIRVEFGEVPEKAEALPTPRLILQPVLENAFEHGLKDTEENGLVRIRFQDTEDGCVITVEDNGDTLSNERLEALSTSMDDEAGETTALKNICHRLRLHSTDGLAFVLRRSEIGGLCVQMTIRREVVQ